MRIAVGPGDFLSMLVALGPDAAARDELAHLLGMRIVPRSEAPPATTRVDEPPASIQPPKRKTTTDQDVILEPAVVEPVAADKTGLETRDAEPAWWSSTKALESEADASTTAPPLIPLFHPDRQRDIVRRMLESARRDRRIDVAELTRMISRHEPVLRIPRLKIHKVAAPVAMIVDPTPTMAAYQDDVLALAAEIRNLVGRSSLSIARTREPTSRELRAAVILIISDLRGPWSGEVGSDASTWTDVIRAVTDAGAKVKLLMPAAVTTALPSLPAPIVEWSHRTRAVHLRRQRPQLAMRGRSLPLLRLATMLAPAVRVEPALIRKLRVELMPDDGPEVEGTLRASTLVDVANATGITLRRDAREQLMKRLTHRAARVRLDAVMQRIHGIHASGPPLIALEERVTHLALAANPGWEDRAAAEVRRVTRAMSDSRRGLARWLEQATQRMPASVAGTHGVAEASIRAERFLKRPLNVPADRTGVSADVERFLRAADDGTETVSFVVSNPEPMRLDVAQLMSLEPSQLEVIAKQMGIARDWLHAVGGGEDAPPQPIRGMSSVLLARDVARVRGQLTTNIAWELPPEHPVHGVRRSMHPSLIEVTDHEQATVVVAHPGHQALERWLERARSEPGFMLLLLAPSHDGIDPSWYSLAEVFTEPNPMWCALAVSVLAMFARGETRLHVEAVPGTRRDGVTVALPAGSLRELRPSAAVASAPPTILGNASFESLRGSLALAARGRDVCTVRALPDLWIGRLVRSSCRIHIDPGNGTTIERTACLAGPEHILTAAAGLSVDDKGSIRFGDEHYPARVANIVEGVANIDIEVTRRAPLHLEVDPPYHGAAMTFINEGAAGLGHLLWGTATGSYANGELTLIGSDVTAIADSVSGAPILVEGRLAGIATGAVFERDGHWVLPFTRVSAATIARLPEVSRAEEPAAVPDVYIACLPEDREAYANPIATALLRGGVTVTFDRNVMRDESIRGRPRVVVAILSRTYLARGRIEMDGLRVLAESAGAPTVIPIRCGVTVDQVRSASLSFGARQLGDFAVGVDALARQIRAAVINQQANGGDVPEVEVARACAFIRLDEGTYQTGFLVEPQLLATKYFGQVDARSYPVRLAGVELSARIWSADPVGDFTLMRLDRALTDVAPLALTVYDATLGADWRVHGHAGSQGTPVTFATGRRDGAASVPLTSEELTFPVGDPRPDESSVGAPLLIGNQVVARVEWIKGDRLGMVLVDGLVERLRLRAAMEAELEDVAAQRAREPDRADELDRSVAGAIERARGRMFGALQLQEYWLRNTPTWRIAALTAAAANPPTKGAGLAELVAMALRESQSPFEDQCARTAADLLEQLLPADERALLERAKSASSPNGALATVQASGASHLGYLVRPDLVVTVWTSVVNDAPIQVELTGSLYDAQRVDEADPVTDTALLRLDRPVPNVTPLIADTDATSAHAVFLSFANEDRETAMALQSALWAAGVPVWTAESGLRAGDDSAAVVRDNLARSTLFLPLISRHTDASTPDQYLYREWSDAIERASTYPPGVRYILPLALDRVDAATARVPEELRRLQWHALHGRTVNKELVEVVVTEYRRKVAFEAANRRGSDALEGWLMTIITPAPIFIDVRQLGVAMLDEIDVSQQLGSRLEEIRGAPVFLRENLVGHLSADGRIVPIQDVHDAIRMVDQPPRAAQSTTPPSQSPPVARLVRTLNGHTRDVTACAVTPDGTRVVTTSHDRTVRVWDLATGEERALFRGHTHFVYDCAITWDGSRIVTASEDRMVRVWDLPSGKTIHVLEGHRDPVRACAVSPDGHRAVSGSVDKTVRVWDLDSGKSLFVLRGHEAPVYGCLVTPDGVEGAGRIISAGRDDTLRVWSLEDGKPLGVMKQRRTEWLTCAITPDGRELVTSGVDRTIVIWDLETQRERTTLRGHTESVWSVTVTPDGRHIVSGGNDRTIKVWERASGELVASFDAHEDAIYCCVVTADGQIVSASKDKTVKVWTLDALSGRDDRVASA